MVCTGDYLIVVMARNYFEERGYFDEHYVTYMWKDKSVNPPISYRIRAPYSLMKNNPYKGVFYAGYLEGLGLIKDADTYPLLPDERLPEVLPPIETKTKVY